MQTINKITKEELLSMMLNDQEVQIVNVLEPKYYDLGMIEGSLKIPLSELEQRKNEIDATKEVVVYCASQSCDASRNAAEKLADWGYNVRAYEGGIREWKAAGCPTE